MQDLIVVLPHQGELEPIFSRIDRNRSRFGVAIEAVDDFAFDASQVDWLLECFDDSIITI
jgi:hypothetical protein